MQYFYAILWFTIGLILIFSVSRENKIFYFAGGFFLFLGVWWLLDACIPGVNLFAGTYGIVFRCVGGVALVILAVSFVKTYRRGKLDSEHTDEKKD